MLILDFDGVIADAFTECAVVTYYADHEPAAVADKPLATLAANLPAGFLQRFRLVRTHARLLQDFMVARNPAAEAITSVDDYEALLESIPAKKLASLTRGATAVRKALREQQSEAWLAMHTLYPGIGDLLRRHQGRGTSVVTAKDEDSVWQILAHHGLESTVTQVIGECSDKRTAVQELASADGLPASAITFIDDHITNALAVRDTGATSLWAWWGYHTPGHIQRAITRKQRRVYLPELPQLTA
ncbi:HAD family hydrolase [Streptomyces sp. H39-C1]|uniref:HAD family hydrolase n=1 Tax=Streptomyces sp. H39-C1 TaxID=3004355 RepID=UPI0022B04222|nr:HAD family hydrolase [Streptomyces sp. H39-C1]MCZ4103025.1 HAD hydrolase-like protein [Streptomyces sp. H39-C1]